MSLELRNVTAFYGASQALFGMDLTVETGSVTTLLGRNGMGKTTTVNTIIGHITNPDGEIHYRGRRIDGLPPFRIARLGIGLVPEGRQVFPNLTVRENLVATAANYNTDHGSGENRDVEPWTLERVLELFPQLGQRLGNMGNQLSGGEQQMLALGRAMMLNPSLLVMDEATEGLAPLIREQIWQQLDRIRQTGISILLIDKNLDELSRIADFHYIIEKGRVVWHGDNEALKASPELKSRYLGI